MLKKILLLNLFVLLLLNVKGQECHTVQRDVKSYEDWYILLDSLFHEAIVDSTEAAYAWLVLKVDSSGFMMSTHIRGSRNMDSSAFYKICSKMEDCYSYSFIAKTYHPLGEEYKRLISKEYMYLQYVYRFHPKY